jgi:hypothetical protein
MALWNAGEEFVADETSNPRPWPGVGSGKFVTPFARIHREKASAIEGAFLDLDPNPVVAVVVVVLASSPAAVSADPPVVLVRGGVDADPQPAIATASASVAPSSRARRGAHAAVFRSAPNIVDTLSSLVTVRSNSGSTRRAVAARFPPRWDACRSSESLETLLKRCCGYGQRRGSRLCECL